MKEQQLVQDFHQKFGHPVAQPGGWRNIDPEVVGLRFDLIREEAEETTDALEKLRALRYRQLCETVHARPEEDEVRAVTLEVVDGLCDIIYAALGTAVSLGVELGPHFAEVHRANMDKRPVVKRAHEKYGPGGGKPEGWVPPDHDRLLRAAEV